MGALWVSVKKKKAGDDCRFTLRAAHELEVLIPPTGSPDQAL